jgi:hypothetical protein
MLNANYRYIKIESTSCLLFCGRKKHNVKVVLLSTGIRANQVCGGKEEAQRRRQSVHVYSLVLASLFYNFVMFSQTVSKPVCFQIVSNTVQNRKGKYKRITDRKLVLRGWGSDGLSKKENSQR